MARLSERQSTVVLLLAIVDLSAGKLQLTLCLVQAALDGLQLSCLGIKLTTVLRLQVFLDAHPQNILVDWQLHLLSQSVELTVFGFNACVHGPQPLLAVTLRAFARGYFFDQALLVGIFFSFQGLMMGLELGKKLCQLILFTGGVFVEFRDRFESLLDVVFLGE